MVWVKYRSAQDAGRHRCNYEEDGVPHHRMLTNAQEPWSRCIWGCDVDFCGQHAEPREETIAHQEHVGASEEDSNMSGVVQQEPSSFLGVLQRRGSSAGGHRVQEEADIDTMD